MTHLTLTCLGGFSASRDDEPITNFRSAKTRALLVYLAVESGRAHPRESLIDLLWSEQEPTKANANFRQSLSRLQRVIGNKEANPPFLTVTRQSVQWNSDSPFSLDVAELRQGVDDFAAEGDVQPSPERLHAAIDGYGGDFLAGFFVDDAPYFEDWAAAVREEMHQTLFRGLSLLADHADGVGDFPQAEALARRQLNLIPWDETAHRRLMQALAMQGQRNEALAQYDRCFAVLEEELGVEPGEATEALYEKIATGVVVALQEEELLPRPVTSFVGRVAEIGYVVRTLSHPDCGLLTLAGPGGAGKTRLALEVARKFIEQTGQDVAFASLVGVGTLAQAQAALARTLAITLVDPEKTTAQIREALRERALLLIVDNAESLAADPAGEFVAWLDAIRAGADGLRLLVTSRQPLQAQAEWVLPVEGMAWPASAENLWPDAWQNYDALELFAQRARQSQMAFAVTPGNLPYIVRICRAVEGLPLALELAAAQVRQRSVAEIAAGLEESPADLAADLRDLPIRQRSLHAVFAQSWALLSDAQQNSLARCAVFAGPFGRAAARSVLGEDADHLPALVEHSLLRRRMRTASQGSPLFALAPPLRAFLRAERPLADDDRNRHATFYLAWAADHPAMAANEGTNVAAAWRWAESAGGIEVPAGWDPAWLDETEPANIFPDRPAVGGGLPLVGRSAEMTELRGALRPLLEEKRNGGLLVISGAAGIGKSHLVAQLKRETPGVVWFDCACDETHRQALHPIRQALGRYFGQTPGAPTEQDRAAFDARFADLRHATADPTLRVELEEVRSYLAALVDLILPGSPYLRAQPAQREQQFQQAIRLLLHAECLQQPLIIHVEDAHWLDEESRSLLRFLLRSVEGLPFAIVATARPAGFDPPALVDTAVHALGLQPLGPEGVSALAAAYLGSTPGEALVELLVSRAGGNPFHTEQLLRYLHDSGLIVAAELKSGAGSSPDTPLPLDVHNVLVARLNRLDEGVRSVVAQASVLGREFSLAELDALVGETGRVAGALAAGEEEAIWQPASSGRYQFHHALLHHAAYDNQFDSQKQEGHRRAALTLMRADSAGPDLARIAHHWDEAGERQQAVGYYVQAGDQARQNHFIREAHALYSRGLALAERENHLLALRLGREAVNHWLGNREEQAEDLRGLVELTAGSEDKAQLAEIALRQATFALSTGAYDRAVTHAQAAARLGAQVNNYRLEAQALHRWGRAQWQQGNPQAAAPLLRRALRLAEAAGDPVEQAQCLFDLSSLAFSADEYAKAEAQIGEALALFAAENDSRNVIRCVSLLGLIANGEGRYEAALVQYEKALSLCRNIDWPYGEAQTLGHLGNCLFELCAFERCRQMHTQAVELARQLENRELEAYSLDTIGLAHQFEGNLAEARRFFEEALAIHTAIGNRRSSYTLTHLGLCLTDMEEIEQAGILLYEALAARGGSSQEGLSVDTKAALAWLDMARGEIEFAGEQIRDVVDWLAVHGSRGVELPVQVYWQCYTILRMTGAQEEANQVLQSAHDLLQERATRIENEARRQRYLTGSTPHRQILTAAASVVP